MRDRLTELREWNAWCRSQGMGEPVNLRLAEDGQWYFTFNRGYADEWYAQKEAKRQAIFAEFAANKPRHEAMLRDSGRVPTT